MTAPLEVFVERDSVTGVSSGRVLIKAHTNNGLAIEILLTSAELRALRRNLANAACAPRVILKN